MNRGVFESSLVQIMGGNPTWWNMSNMRSSQDASPPSLASQQHHDILSNYIPMSSWCEDQTWSQLLMGEERYSLSGPFQTKKMENLENYVIYNSQGAQIPDLKQENSSFSSNMLNFSNKKAERKYQLIDQSSESNRTGNGGALKKARIQGSSLSQPSALKVRKEKLGDRITALHQLVSPFGKTDTASVLFEAFGYIRFLQSQIEALSSPYLARGSGNLRQHDVVDEQRKDLRSRGLCLVPVLCTMHVESNINGADYWASSIGGDY